MFRAVFYFVLFNLIPFSCFAYIDPGSGFPFVSSAPFIIGALFVFFGGIFFFVKKYFKVLLIILLILGCVGFTIWRSAMDTYRDFSKKIVVIGMDALDPELIEKFMEEGALPNFSKLKESGSLYPLKTVCPPESIVVWTSFSTGMNPGNHGIFDFIMRDPKNYLPYLSLTDIRVQQDSFKIGPFKIPFLKTSANKRRKSSAFWEITSKSKVPTYAYFCPGSFPPDKVYGKLISGMGVPDIRGTMGTFSFYTTKLLEKDKYIGGLVFHVEKDENNTIEAYIYGPKDTSCNPPQEIKIPLRIYIKPESKEAKIEIQDQLIHLKKGEWSDWLILNFKVNNFKRVKGICRFYLKNTIPEFELYCSPINFNPASPIFPISYPGNFSKKIAKEIGLFHTQGMPYATWALNERRIGRRTFLEQANSVLEEREKIFKKEFLSFRGGLFFFYFEYPDIIQHMFWHDQDVEDSPYREVIPECYKRMDRNLGWLMDNMDKETLLMVLSDHGFGPFEKSVHLNSWLRDNGFLFLKNSKKESKEFFENVDWSRTKAYALGLGGIYINQAGRESQGIVFPGEDTEKIKKEIIDKLSKAIDSKTGNLIIKKVYSKEEVFEGKFNQDSPDLFTGFNLGYRVSWQTALGGVPLNFVEDNLKVWRGDHIFDPSLMDGVLFINKKIVLQRKPKIIDIIPTILKVLNIDCKEMDGKPLF